MKFPILYGVSSKGKVKQWSIETRDNKNGTWSIITRYGEVDGKHQKNEVVISEGKNIGKTNETTPKTQSESEARSKWNKKKDEGYIETLPNVKDHQVQLPMLALRFDKRKHDIRWPALVQPKLNGVRCLAIREGNSIRYISRKGKEYTTLEHLTPYLLEMIDDGMIFDGEIYKHDWTFQEITRNVKKYRKTTKELQYWVYDIADETKIFDERNIDYDNRIRACKDKFPPFSVPIISVYGKMMNNEEEVRETHDIMVSQGYEGVIIRNLNGLYKFKHRSKDLQKLKSFEDDEFEIVGGHPAAGTEEGCVVFDCITSDGKPFAARPKGTREQRREWMKNIDKLIGKMLTVRYLELSEEGVPTGNTVALAIRDYE